MIKNVIIENENGRLLGTRIASRQIKCGEITRVNEYELRKLMGQRYFKVYEAAQLEDGHIIKVLLNKFNYLKEDNLSSLIKQYKKSKQEETQVQEQPSKVEEIKEVVEDVPAQEETVAEEVTEEIKEVVEDAPVQEETVAEEVVEEFVAPEQKVQTNVQQFTQVKAPKVQQYKQGNKK